MKEQRPFGDWWKNHILLRDGEECANEAILEGHLSCNKAIRHNMWKLIGNSLYRVEKLKTQYFYKSLTTHKVGALKVEHKIGHSHKNEIVEEIRFIINL